MLGRERADVVGGVQRTGAGKQQRHRGVAQDRVGQLVDRGLADALGEPLGEDLAQRVGHPLDRRAIVSACQLEHQRGFVGHHSVQHPVPTEPQDRQGERLDIVIRLRPGFFQLGGDIGEQRDVLALDDGGDQLVLVGEPTVDGRAADSRTAGDVFERDATQAMPLELDDSGVEDGFGARIRSRAYPV